MDEEWPAPRQQDAIRALENALAQCHRAGVFLYNASGSLVAYDRSAVMAGGYSRGGGDLTKILSALDALDRSSSVRCPMAIDGGDY